MLQIHQSGVNLTSEALINNLNEMGEKYGYTIKTYNLLALALLLKNDYQRALKIYENALNELKLETPEGQ